MHIDQLNHCCEKSVQAQAAQTHVTKRVPVHHGYALIRSFSNYDGDGNEDVKKVIGLLSKTTALHVHHAFLYISLPPLHDYNVKMPNFTFYGERKQATTNFSFSF